MLANGIPIAIFVVALELNIILILCRLFPQQEGFAMDWSPTTEGTLATGDCSNCIYVTRPTESSWAADPVPFVGHVGSVEDLQWSPTESTVGTYFSAKGWNWLVWCFQRRIGDSFKSEGGFFV